MQQHEHTADEYAGCAVAHLSTELRSTPQLAHERTSQLTDSGRQLAQRKIARAEASYETTPQPA